MTAAVAKSKGPDALHAPAVEVAGSGASQEKRRSLFPVVDNGQRKSTAGESQPVGLMGLLASKKVAGKLASKMYERRKTLPRDSTSGGMSAAVKLENTYRLEPKARLPESSVRAIVQTVLNDTLDKYIYKPRTAPIVCRKMTEEIKEQTKGLNINRYKLVVTVMMGEKGQQSMMVASRCAWDEKHDNYATYTFSNASIFCTATVYGVYAE